MCTVLLPPGVNPIAVNKYVISYHIICPDVGANSFLKNFIMLGNMDLKGDDSPLACGSVVCITVSTTERFRDFPHSRTRNNVMPFKTDCLRFTSLRRL